MTQIFSYLGLPLLLFGFGLTVFWFRYRKLKRLGTVSPVGEKMLRPPGHSLRKRIASIEDLLFVQFMAYVFLPLAVGYGTLLTSIKIGINSWALLWIVIGICFVVVIAGWIIAFHLCTRRLDEWLNCELGLRGEELVAQYLSSLGGENKVFHDFPIEGRGKAANIDHIVVGPNGVFVLETKMRRKHKNLKARQESHRVEYNGQELIYPNFKDRHGLAQTEANAKHLEDFIFRETGRKCPVKGILVLPGWYVSTSRNGPVLVRNHKSIAATISKHQTPLDSETMRRTAEAVRKKCCDVSV